MISHTKFLGILVVATSEMARDYADCPVFMTVCTSFHIMIFLNDVFSVLSWRFGVQCLPSICGRIILLPCFLSSSFWTRYHGMNFIVTFLPRCLLDVAFRAFSLSAVEKLFHGNYVRWPVSAIQPTSFQCTISSDAPLQLMNPSMMPAHAFSCAGPFAVFCIRVCIIFLWCITLLLLFYLEWKDMAWRKIESNGIGESQIRMVRNEWVHSQSRRMESIRIESVKAWGSKGL